MKLNRNSLLIAGSIVALGMTSTNASAEVRINGFASIYGGITTDSDQDKLFGYDDDVAFNPESLFGLQVSADISEKLTATAQLLARGENDYDADFEWAYLTYSFNDEMSLSAGRIRIPLFMYSEYLDVGYAYPWARTPQAVYDVNFNNMDGLRFNYATSLGMWDAELQAVYGKFDGDLNIGGVPTASTLENFAGLSLDLTYDWFSVRASYYATSVTIGADVSAIQPFFALEPEKYNDLVIEEDTGTFGGIGATVDYNDWILGVEWVTYTVDDSIIQTTDAGYVTIGKRFDSSTIIYTYSFLEAANDTSAVSGIPSTLCLAPNPADPTQCALLARDFVANDVFLAEVENDNHSVTYRWDFNPAAALKFDYTYKEYSLRDNLPSDDSQGVFTVGVDLVF